MPALVRDEKFVRIVRTITAAYPQMSAEEIGRRIGASKRTVLLARKRGALIDDQQEQADNERDR